MAAARPPLSHPATWRRLASKYRRPLVALCGGVVSALSLPPADLYPAMIVGMAFLGWAVAGASSFWRGFALGLLWGTGGQLVGMRFVPTVIQLFTDLGAPLSILAHVLLSTAQSLHWAIGMGVAVLLRRRLKAPLELALASGVLIALSIPSVFVWSPAGLLTPWPMLVQAADLIGERGVSALFAVVAALWVRALRHARADGARSRAALTALAGSAFVISALLAYGAWAMRHHEATDDAARARVALIHAGVHPKDRWDSKNWPKILWTLKDETTRAEAAGVDLSIWPEAAYPFPINHDDRRAPRGYRSLLGGAVTGPILFGYIARLRPVLREDGSEEANSHNAATVVSSGGDLQPSYDKMELLWFGEMVPLGQHVPALRRLFHRSGSLVPGTVLRGLSTERRRGDALEMGVLNCYEDTLPDHGRRIMKELRPNLLVNVTNDAWFVGTVEPELHLRLSVMRSIELRRDLVRAVNLGVAGWIDATGTVRARYDAPEPGSLLVEPTLRRDTTVYARFGDGPAALALLLGIALAHRRGRPTG